jgi:putative membrane protein
MKTEWIAFSFFFLAAMIHIGFFVFETFLLQKTSTAKRMGITGDAHKAVKPWAFNQGFYNLFLALGTLSGLYMIFQKKIMTAGALVSFCGLSMIGAGIALWFSIPRLRKFALLQLAPPLIGFIFLFFHVRGSV